MERIYFSYPIQQLLIFRFLLFVAELPSVAFRFLDFPQFSVSVLLPAVSFLPILFPSTFPAVLEFFVVAVLRAISSVPDELLHQKFFSSLNSRLVEFLSADFGTLPHPVSLRTNDFSFPMHFPNPLSYEIIFLLPIYPIGFALLVSF